VWRNDIITNQGGYEMRKYKTIVIDPPWKYGKWGKANPKSRPNSIEYDLPYDYMTIEEIGNIPLKEIADENCELYVWTTQKYLPNTFDIIKKWGFKYCQTLTWCKKPRGTGQGGVYCPTNEFLILARRGKMPKVKRIDSTWWLTKRPHNSHSTKPEFFQDMIETVTDEPRLEMFARREREGWDVFGNEVENSINLKLTI
jgi:N6-adenosine-specific RNA methylase IME4